ncbi:hypothetical protein EDB92DRAFT_1815677 [Lactarius akahatsu]|uniref:Uncharacterized protein n=1 Tax=Lactarius akahatsu TaxID=416441 RepID=A0AAD4QBM4_9AGAM|nr:hypothetical protein EDB92DRAFT_1815677 [Lactarius akahatsu]
MSELALEFQARVGREWCGVWRVKLGVNMQMRLDPHLDGGMWCWGWVRNVVSWAMTWLGPPLDEGRWCRNWLFRKGLGLQDEGGDLQLAELEPPPPEVTLSVVGRGVWDKRTVVEGGQHGLRAGELHDKCVEVPTEPKAIWKVLPPVPDAAAALPASPMGQDLMTPFGMMGIVALKVLALDPEKDVVVNPLCQWADAISVENICISICNHSIDTSSRCEAKIDAHVDSEAVICLEANDQARPLGGDGRDGPVCLSDVTYRSLGPWGEVGNDKGDSGEGPPGDPGKGVVWVQEVVYCLVFAWLGCFGDKQERGGLERAQLHLHLCLGEWADVMASGGLYDWDAEAEAVGQALEEGGVFSEQVKVGEIISPGVAIV